MSRNIAPSRSIPSLMNCGYAGRRAILSLVLLPLERASRGVLMAVALDAPHELEHPDAWVLVKLQIERTCQFPSLGPATIEARWTYREGFGLHRDDVPFKLFVVLNACRRLHESFLLFVWSIHRLVKGFVPSWSMCLRHLESRFGRGRGEELVSAPA